jgi:phospholipid-binding lipoprotein MlaA
MNVLRLLPPLLIALSLAACAGKAPKSPPPAATPVAPAPADEAATPAAADAAATGADAAPATTAATTDATDAAAATAAGDAPTSAEDDYAALYGGPAPSANGEDLVLPGTPPAYDPWERYNRGMHRFNNAVDRAIAKPLATGYSKVVPRPVRLGVTNFFDNLRSPLTMVNQLLQGHPVYAVQTLGRFVMNTTLGIGGLFDPASAAKIPRRSEDFGQTLGVWGWRNSRYFELPFFGPRTVRDTFGLAGDVPLSPLRQIDDDTVRYGLQGLQLVDARAQLLSLDALREQAPDEYALTRDAWLQRRNYQISRDRHGHKDQTDPQHEDGTPTVPTDAIPIPD